MILAGQNNYLLTYDSYVPLYNRFHRGEWITRVSGGEGALDTPGPKWHSRYKGEWGGGGPGLENLLTVLVKKFYNSLKIGPNFVKFVAT
jgi:hypothetical protein